MSQRRLPSSPLAVLALAVVACSPRPSPQSVHPEPARTDLREPAEAERPPLAPVEEDLYGDAREAFEARCVVCHGCYDAPCQLKLDAPEGMHRGASKQRIYESTRLVASTPTRLGIDAQTIDEWRALDFHPVIETNPAGAATDRSVILRMLDLKRRNPLPADKLLPDDFTLELNREQVCATSDEMDEFEEDHPLWGMPYGLPGIDDETRGAIERWLRDGSPIPEPVELSSKVQRDVQRWEAFLNQDALREQLMARYIYEHLFLATLTLTGDDGHEARFRLVRSATPPGEPIEELATRRPFDPPGVPRPYYRLRRRTAAQLSKTHMPYALSDDRMARYRELFLADDYAVDALPGYEAKDAANPFRTFQALPARARYAFMLDEAEFTLMGFIKGPVCRGQVALDVIQDRFWIAFVDPDSPLLDAETDFLRDNASHLELPADAGSTAMLSHWLRYSRNERNYLEAKSAFLERMSRELGGPSLGYVWDGDGHNDNAALTVFRHFDSATVARGFWGKPPKTAWVLSYSVLERIHYLLVAGFDVFGNLGHQVNTRLYMDFLRMEAEHNFLLLLPKASRRPLVDFWYRGTSRRVKNEVYGSIASFEGETTIAYRSDDPKSELLGMLHGHLDAVVDRRRSLERVEDATVRNSLLRLQAVGGQAAAQMPELSLLYVPDALEGEAHYTILRDSAHENVAYMFREEARRLPEEDALTVLPGFLGAYPNAFFVATRDQLAKLVVDVSKIDGPEAYEAFVDRYGVRRTDADFWQHSDLLRRARAGLTDSEAGLLDYNRLENR